MIPTAPLVPDVTQLHQWVIAVSQALREMEAQLLEATGQQGDLTGTLGQFAYLDYSSSASVSFGAVSVGGSAVWHAGNDGTASGLDADLLDGQHGAYYADVPARLGYTPLNAASYTAADVLTKLLTVDGTGSGLDADLLDGQSSAYYVDIVARLGYTPLNSATYTAADVLAKLLTVDGTGSGIDADLLDGQSGAYYTDIPTRLGYTPLNTTAYTAADVLSKLLTVDGAGSGLDADLLDGSQGSAFAKLSGNQTFAGNQTIQGNLAFTGGYRDFSMVSGNATSTLQPIYDFGGDGSDSIFLNANWDVRSGVYNGVIASAGIRLKASNPGQGLIGFYTAGTGGAVPSIKGYVSNGLVMGSPTGGDKGAGTINATAVYDDNTLLTDLVLDLAATGTWDTGYYGMHPLNNELRADWFDFDWYKRHITNERRLPGMPFWSPDTKPPLGEVVTRLIGAVETLAVLVVKLDKRVKGLGN